MRRRCLENTATHEHSGELYRGKYIQELVNHNVWRPRNRCNRASGTMVRDSPHRPYNGTRLCRWYQWYCTSVEIGSGEERLNPEIILCTLLYLLILRILIRMQVRHAVVNSMPTYWTHQSGLLI
jgi:hypothetical protein